MFSRIKAVAAWCFFATFITLHAAEDLPPVPDILVYENGDRVSGRLLSREGDMMVFRSTRFGDLRVPAAEARVISSAEEVALPATPKTGVKASQSVQPVSSSPHQLARYVKNVFGPWSGRLALSTQVTNDTNNRSDAMAELSLERTWAKEEVNLSTRYDYSKTNEIDTTDTFKANGMWRHSLPRRLFTVYRPAYEWNRAATIDGVNSDYILLQQEVGLGVKAVDRESWKIRVGVAENFFNNWDLTTDTEHSEYVESLFFEADLKLPWRIVVTERAVYYYSLASGNTGWEHQFELTKKLTETLSLGLRHESRYNDPDIRTEDYSMLRFLLGLDF